MKKRFRALNVISSMYKILAWVVLVGMGLMAIAILILGVIQGGRGPSAQLADVPVVSQVNGALAGIVAGLLMMVGALLAFVLIYGMSDVIDLAIALEENTRETAKYLKGETALPAPPQPIPWDAPLPEHKPDA